MTERHPGDRVFHIQKKKMEDTAVLSSFKDYTTFTFAGTTLTFRTCSGLERYTRIITWDEGYIEVMTKYRQREYEIEEYIDLIPVLDELYMDRNSFLSPIRNVRIEYPFRYNSDNQ